MPRCALRVIALAMLVAAGFPAEDASAGLRDWLGISGSRDRDEQREANRARAARELEAFLKKRAFLDASASATYANAIQTLVGQYIYEGVSSDNKPEIKMIGSTFPVKQIKMDLKDFVVFKAVVEEKFNQGLNIPFLFVNFERAKAQVAELAVQDIGSVLTERPDANEATCFFPLMIPPGARGKQVMIVTGATVTYVSKRMYDKGESGGDVAFAQIKFAGKRYTSTEIIQKEPVVSITTSEATPLDPEDKAYAQKKAECDAMKNRPKTEGPKMLISSTPGPDSHQLMFGPQPLAGKIFSIGE